MAIAVTILGDQHIHAPFAILVAVGHVALVAIAAIDGITIDTDAFHAAFESVAVVAVVAITVAITVDRWGRWRLCLSLLFLLVVDQQGALGSAAAARCDPKTQTAQQSNS
jgi:hypothetical protein